MKFPKDQQQKQQKQTYMRINKNCPPDTYRESPQSKASIQSSWTMCGVGGPGGGGFVIPTLFDKHFEMIHCCSNERG